MIRLYEAGHWGNKSEIVQQTVGNRFHCGHCFQHLVEGLEKQSLQQGREVAIRATSLGVQIHDPSCLDFCHIEGYTCQCSTNEELPTH